MLGGQIGRAYTIFFPQATSNSAGINLEQLRGPQPVPTRVLQHCSDDRVANLTHWTAQRERQREGGLHFCRRVGLDGSDGLGVGPELPGFLATGPSYCSHDDLLPMTDKNYRHFVSIFGSLTDSPQVVEK